MLKYAFTKTADCTGDEFITNEWLINQYKSKNISLYHDNLLNRGIYKRMGFIYDFKDILKKYVYKTNFGIYEGFAPNKTLLRKNIHTRIYYILEIK